MMAEAFGCEQTVEGYLAYIKENWEKPIEEEQKYVPVICGEWCLFNSLTVGIDTKGGQSMLNGMDFTGDRNVMSDDEKTMIFRTLCEAQLNAWRKGSG